MPESHFPQSSNEELVLGALLGSLEAFDELVRRFRGAVIAVAEQVLGCHDAAEDVAQEAFLLAFQALPQLQDPSKFGSWLCAITRNRALRVGVRDARSKPVEPSDLDRLVLKHSHELSPHPLDELVRKAGQVMVRAILSELPPENRTVLRLYYYEEWPVRQIADFLSLPITTVKWRLHQGRRLMRRRLTEQQEAESK